MVGEHVCGDGAYQGCSTVSRRSASRTNKLGILANLNRLEIIQPISCIYPALVSENVWGALLQRGKEDGSMEGSKETDSVPIPSLVTVVQNRRKYDLKKGIINYNIVTTMKNLRLNACVKTNVGEISMTIC